ncbi:MAG: hypothetical protein IKQ85_06835 [Bacteroidaceae bacterium]|nr:hypothetical protein [Bacteroidaceae bacterium]
MIHFTRKHILAAFMFASAAAWAEEANTFYFTDAVLMPGETANIELCMKNVSADLTCLEAEIQLPEGLSLALDEEGNPIATLYRNRSVNHELLTGILKNGNLKLLVSDIKGHVFSGKEGPILSFRVRANDTAPTGEYSVATVGESLLVNTAAKGIYSVGVAGNVLITDDPTDLKDLEDAKDSDDKAIYNLAGQIVNSKSSNSKLPRGIFIKNGQKTLFK